MRKRSGYTQQYLCMITSIVGKNIFNQFQNYLGISIQMALIDFCIFCLLQFSDRIYQLTITLPSREKAQPRIFNLNNINTDMNLYQGFILALLLIAGTSTFVNTTDFWKKKLNLTTEMGYECYSGYEEIDWYYGKGQTGMYYSFFGAHGHSIKEADERVPLMIWLQGGPGASSQFGAFTEIGPIKVVKDKVSQISLPWNLMGHTLFVDNPLTVGFSYNRDKSKPLVSSASQAADHLLNFLYNLYNQWPQLKKSPLYLTGESFAGHYIPAFAEKILSNNTFLRATGINFEGIAIGDGWTDPYNQINFYDSYLYSVGVVSNKFRDTCTWFQTKAIQHIDFQDFKNATPFFDFLTNNDDTRYQYWGGMSTYNFRQYGEGDFSFAALLNNSRAELGIPQDIYYVPGSDDIYDAFQADITKSYADKVIGALRRMKVLIYNGQDDFVVNTAGVLNYLNGLNWQGINAWKRTRKAIWTVHGQVKGWAKVSGNLWFVLINHAGHMVPTDQPEAAFNMLGHFIFDHKDWKE